MQALFISESTLKEFSVISDNVDPKLLESIIETAQNLYIHPVLGTALYKDIQLQITSGTVSDAYKTLLDDYIQPALVEWVKYEGAPELTIKIGNKSIGKHQDEYQQPATLEEIRFIMEHWRNRAEELTTRLRRFLCANTSTYTKFTESTDASDIQPQAETYYGGMYLGSSLSWKKGRLRDKYQS